MICDLESHMGTRTSSKKDISPLNVGSAQKNSHSLREEKIHFYRDAQSNEPNHIETHLRKNRDRETQKDPLTDAPLRKFNSAVIILTINQIQKDATSQRGIYHENHFDS